MLDKINYAKELDKIISDFGSSRKENGEVYFPRLLLHCCCAPCSSYTLMYLLPYFDITCFFYNPNITDEDEYKKRLDELHRLVGIINRMAEDIVGTRGAGNTAGVPNMDDMAGCPGNGEIAGTTGKYDEIPVSFPEIKLIDGDYEPDIFFEKVKKDGLEACPEGGKRCEMCFDLRLTKAYEVAASGNFDYFGTTLTISPHKNAQLINSIGYDIAKKGAAGCSGNASPLWLPSDLKKNNGFKISIELSEKFGLYRQDYCGCVYSRR